GGEGQALYPVDRGPEAGNGDPRKAGHDQRRGCSPDHYLGHEGGQSPLPSSRPLGPGGVPAVYRQGARLIFPHCPYFSSHPAEAKRFLTASACLFRPLPHLTATMCSGAVCGGPCGQKRSPSFAGVLPAGTGSVLFISSCTSERSMKQAAKQKEAFCRHRFFDSQFV